MSTSTLTQKQKYFCDLYLQEGNSHIAAIRAGYSHSVARNGSLLNKPEVQEYIQARQKELAEKISVTSEMILTELAKMAFSDDEKIKALNGDKPVKVSARNKMLALDKLAKHLGFYGKGRSSW